ncbi:hypothetical protein JCM6882_004022 [Rhodosporidiobolus microsporus]
MYYSDKNYSLSFEREYRLPTGGKLWESVAVDINATTFFYVELCYEDVLLSKISSIGFDKDAQDASRLATSPPSMLERLSASPSWGP